MFPACLVDARTASLRVLPLSELTQVSARGGEVVLAFGGRTFAFPPATPGEVDASVQAVEAARAELANAADDEARRLLDPLAAPSVASPLTPDVARTRTAPAWEKWRFVIGAAVGGVIGAALFFARDVGSDARCLAWAKARNDVPSYEKYSSRGRRHTDLVAKGSCPAPPSARPWLRARRGDRCLRAGAPRHEIQRESTRPATPPSSPSSSAPRRPRRSRASSGSAKSIPTSARSRRSSRRSTPSTRAPSIATSRRRTSPSPTLKRLVAAAEKVEPTKTAAGYQGAVVEVRVRRMPSKEMIAPNHVRKSPMFNGVASLVTTHLDDPHLIPREKALADALAAAFAKAFDPEILTFEAKPRLDDGDGKLPDPKVPTLYVSYRVESSGAALASKKPRGIFLGLTFYFSIELALPGDAQPFKSKLTSTERIPARGAEGR